MLDPTALALFDAPFTPIDEFIRFWASAEPQRAAITDGVTSLTWGEFDDEIDRIAAGLQAQGVGRGSAVPASSSAMARSTNSCFAPLSASIAAMDSGLAEAVSKAAAAPVRSVANRTSA